jgi:NADH-quinone oxidoreductase subunit K
MPEANQFLVPTNYYVILAAVLFSLGVLGVLVRRNAILIFMSID